MKKSNKILILSAVVLLIVVVLIIVIRRRGRKVYLSEEFRLNPDYYVYLYDKFLSNSTRTYHNGNLDYVVLPHNYQKFAVYDTDAYGNQAAEYYPVKALGVLQANGNITRVNLNEYAYINPAYLAL